MDTRDTSSLRILHAAYWHTTACVDYVCKKHIVAEKLEKIGGQVVDFGLDYNGLQTWIAASTQQ